MTQITAAGDDAEVAKYMKEFFRASRALDDAIDMLKARKNNFADFAETQVINANLGDLQRASIDMRAEFHAFLDEGNAVVAPSQEDVDAVQRLSETLAGMNANSARASAIISLATDIAKAFSKTRA